MRFWIEFFAWTSFGAWLFFVAAYAIRAKWWRSPEGRNAMWVSMMLTVAFGMIVAAYTWPDYGARPYVVLSVYVAATILGIQRTAQMLRRQRHVKEG